MPTRLAIAGAALLAVAVTAPSAGRAETPTCQGLAQAPPVEAGATRAWAAEIARAVVDAEARLDLGRPARVELVRSGVAGAWYCAGDDVIYVAEPLLRWAWLGRQVDGRDLLGFAVAHELAHRRFDGGSAALAGAVCPPEDPAREARADRRAAFLLATARDPGRGGRGFSPFNLARHDALGAFFEGELGWAPGCPALERRVAAVGEALARIESLGALYEVALGLALAGREDEAVDAALAAIEAHLTGATWDGLPELDVVAALVHLERAGRAGWCGGALARTTLAPSPCTLACEAAVPRYPALAPRDVAGTRAGREVDRAAELAAVRGRLARAATRGVDAGRLQGIAACAAYLEGDPARALAAAAPSQRPLFALQRFVLEEPGPVGGAAWLAAADALRPELLGDPEVAGAVSAWLGAAPAREEVAAGPVSAPALDAWVRLPACAAAGEEGLGGGWALAHGGGCARLSRGGRARATVVEAAPTGLSRRVAAWRARCELTLRGRDEGGARVWAAWCPAWDGAGESWLLFDGEPLRVVRVAAAGAP